MSKYRATSHVTFNIGYHIIFCPKFRYGVLKWKAADILKEILCRKALELDAYVKNIEVMPDHVHIFLTGKPRRNIDGIVRQLKGYSSFILRKRFSYLNRYPSLWTRSYFVETVGNISEKTVAQYIENQKKALSSPS